MLNDDVTVLGMDGYDFLPDTGFVYPTPKIQPDPDLAGLDFRCKGRPINEITSHSIMSISLSANVEHGEIILRSG